MSKNMQSGASFTHIGCYGQLDGLDEHYTGPVPEGFTLNTPVGVCMDKNRNLWVCDTGNSRVIIFDSGLENILHVLHGIGTKAGNNQKSRFLMPFHACQHPERNRMYITDLGNRRVVVFEYDERSVHFVNSFGSESRDFDPLLVPNGIAIVKEMVEGQPKFYVWINDEFFHTKTDSRNRCVKFDEDGNYVTEFKSVVTTGGKEYILYWPQGLSSDADGNLYIANTGSYEILKCHSKREIDKANFTLVVEEGEVLLHSFGNPHGLGQLNVMRSVSVVGQKVFVPDRKLNTISVYDLNGKRLMDVQWMSPHWTGNEGAMGSVSEFVYTFLENQMLVDPYQVCAGEEDEIYFITEPYLSRVCKVRIPHIRKRSHEMELITAVGARRDNVDKRTGSSQFNAVTAVIGMDEKIHPQSEPFSSLPAYVKYNPFQLGYMTWSKVLTSQYECFYNQFLSKPSQDQDGKNKTVLYHVDAGNWTIKAYSEKNDRFHQVPGALAGLYLPGDLAFALHYPSQPLLGQVCPGTPILFLTNYSCCTVTMYQFGLLGELLNYGLPFGIPGDFEMGGLLGPLGVAVNQYGEIFIADSLNHRISKWKLLQTGQVVFIKTFKWQERWFTPSDVAIDKQNRVFVCDQFNNAIRVFDSDGSNLWSYGKGGYCDDLARDYDQFFLPTSISIDADLLVVNDLVNRMLKIFKIKDNTLEFVTGSGCFNEHPEKGGLWMPFFMYAANGRVYVPDTTFNVVNVYEYKSS